MSDEKQKRITEIDAAYLWKVTIQRPAGNIVSEYFLLESLTFTEAAAKIEQFYGDELLYIRSIEAVQETLWGEDDVP